MLMPSIFGENLFDDWFDDFPFITDKGMKDVEKKLYGKKAGRIMKTDIKEKDNAYELVVDLPGFTKDEIKASVENGYLTISAAKGLDEAFAKLAELDEDYATMCNTYADTVRAANEILHSIKSPSMRSFVILKYMRNMPDIKIRKELNMTRRALEQAKECVENATCMAAVEWKERYVSPTENVSGEENHNI